MSQKTRFNRALTRKVKKNYMSEEEARPLFRHGDAAQIGHGKGKRGGKGEGEAEAQGYLKNEKKKADHAESLEKKKNLRIAAEVE